MPPKANKRRKTQGDEQDGTQKTSKARNVRGKARGGSQANLANIPMDVFMEILVYLLPLDLLHLAKTTKGFREFLMNRAVSLPFWKGARRNVDGLPECPEILSEPEYACLVFGTACNGCGTQRGVDSGPLYAIGVRLCKKCLETKTGQLDTRGNKGANDWLALKDALPNQVAHNYWYVYRRYDIPFQSRTKTPTSGTRILISEVQKVQAIWNKTTSGEREALVAQRKRMIEQWYQLKGHIKTWIQAREAKRLRRIEKLKQIRQDAIFAKLADAGWSEEIAHLKNDRTNFAKFVKKITGSDTKELTDHDWSRLEKAAVTLLEKFKRERAITKLAEDLESHIQTLGEFADDQEFRFNGIFPRVRDLALLPAIRKILESSEDEESLKKALKKLKMHALVDEWKGQCGASLVEDINTAVPSLKLPEDANMEELAIGAYLCCANPKCDERGRAAGYPSVFTFPDILTETCPLKSVPLPVDTVDDYTTAIRQTCSETGHTYAPWVFPVMKRIIETCGCNPKTATREEMDELDVRLMCAHKGCDSDVHTQGVDAFYTWRSAFHHAVEHGREASKFKSAKNDLTDAVLQKIKDLEGANAARAAEILNDMDWRCSHCESILGYNCSGTKKEVLAHVKKNHRIKKPSENDFYLEPNQSVTECDTQPVLLVSPGLPLKNIISLPSIIMAAIRAGSADMKPSD